MKVDLFVRYSQRRAKALVVILIAIFVSVSVSYLTNLWFQKSLLDKPPATEVSTSSEANSPVVNEAHLQSLRSLSQAMVAISSQVKPSVVTVFTERVMRIQRRDPFDMFGNPFFDGFFRDFFPEDRRRGPRVEERRSQGLGSGVILSSEGAIVTNNHVIDGADSIRVRLLDGKTYEAKVMGRDPQTDLALLKIEATGLTAISVGNSDDLQVGEIVLAVGSPMSERLAHTVTQGIVSAKGRANVGIVAFEDFIQTDAAINPGNSGGALVNLSGELVGINTAIASQSGGSQGIGFAIPVNIMKAVTSSLQSTGEVVRAWMGVEVQDLSQELAEALALGDRKGVLVANTEKNGPAAKGGLKSGDLVVEMDGQVIDSAVQLRNKIATAQPGTKLKFKVFRDNKIIDLEIVLEKMPIATSSTKAESDLLGFQVSDINADLQKRLRLSPQLKAVVVTDVMEGSAAEQAGLQAGDLILGVNQKPTPDIKTFRELTKNAKAGDRLLLQVGRRGSTYLVVLRLGS